MPLNRSLARVVRRVITRSFFCEPLPVHDFQDKPSWVDALEESLLLAIGLLTLITWIVMIGLVAH